jgi:ABC-type polar amino acid transport system ATPase subunit
MVQEVLQVIRELAHTGITMLVATHEMGFAREVADHVAFMADGKLIHLAPPKEFFDRPSDPRLTAFLSKVL